MQMFNSTAPIEPSYAEPRSEQIVGSSPALKSALAEVERVAPTNATVLVLGETGTGKELIARAIHSLSPRHEQPFIKLDCAAIPSVLLESELFGHEKGAFTWAVSQKIGRFELAHGGTLFLDEIGDLPLSLQPGLLRILEAQEFERPGSGQTHRVDVRLVAATHRNLVDMVARGEFRGDLYYRLSGFPVILPPLRERREDIALLVPHFVHIFSKRMDKQIHHIPEETLSALTSYSWPGNVRELQNLIERAVILSSDGSLTNPLPKMKITSIAVSPHQGMVNGSQRVTIHSNCGRSPDPVPIFDKHWSTTEQMCSRVPGFSEAPPDTLVVFVVDEDVSRLESTALLIRNAGWQTETFACAREFLERPRPFIPNCLVLDASLQEFGGLGLQRQITVERPATPIIFIAGHGDVPTSVQAMKAGAVEFLIRPFSDEALLGAIRDGLKRSRGALGREAEITSLRERYASLTPRERQVMALVASGLLNKQVGAELGISEITVKAHRGQVMHKMKANSLADLVRMVSRLRSEHGPVSSRSIQFGSRPDSGRDSAVIGKVSAEKAIAQ